MASVLDLTKEQDVHIDQRLRENSILWLITVRPDGRPHAVAVWFLWDGEAILIFSRPETQKVRNLRENPRVVVALDDTRLGDDPITLEGTATLLPPGEIDLTLEKYIEKYGEMIKELGYTPEGMARTFHQGIRIVPQRIMRVADA